MRIDKLIEVEKIDYMAREVLDDLEEFRLIGVVEKEMIFLFSTTIFFFQQRSNDYINHNG
jgi:hypothetical protein